MRHFGIPVSGDPYNGTRLFGINCIDLFNPFDTEGCTVYFEKFAPTNDDINCFTHIVITDGELECDPTGVEMHCDKPYSDNVARVKYMH